MAIADHADLTPSDPPRVAAAQTDAELVARVRAGDERAFEQLYARYETRIRAYVGRMVSDHARAEDVTQDVFLSALRRMRDTDRAIAFKPWVYEIAKNACIDQFRRGRGRDELSLDAEEGLGAADYGRVASVGGDDEPEAAVARKQSLDHLRGAFGGLTRAHHEILVLRELEGRSYAEIGERLGLSRPSVESTLFRARRRLAEEYQELVTGERCLQVQTIVGGAAVHTAGVRERRAVGAHLSHCQGCRRHAYASGVDPAEFAPRPLREKVAALLPLPAFLRRRLTDDGGGPGSGSSVASGHAASFAQWSAQFAAGVDPSVGWAKAASVVGVAAASLGGGSIAVHQLRSSPISHDGPPPAVASPTAAHRARTAAHHRTVAARGASSSSASAAAIGPRAAPVAPAAGRPAAAPPAAASSASPAPGGAGSAAAPTPATAVPATPAVPAGLPTNAHATGGGRPHPAKVPASAAPGAAASAVTQGAAGATGRMLEGSTAGDGTAPDPAAAAEVVHSAARSILGG